MGNERYVLDKVREKQAYLIVMDKCLTLELGQGMTFRFPLLVIKKKKNLHFLE